MYENDHSAGIMWAFIIGLFLGWLLTYYWIKNYSQPSINYNDITSAVTYDSPSDAPSDDPSDSISIAPADDSGLVDCLNNLRSYRDYDYGTAYIVYDVSDVQGCIDSNQ